MELGTTDGAVEGSGNGSSVGPPVGSDVGLADGRGEGPALGADDGSGEGQMVTASATEVILRCFHPTFALFCHHCARHDQNLFKTMHE